MYIYIYVKHNGNSSVVDIRKGIIYICIYTYVCVCIYMIFFLITSANTMNFCIYT